MLQLKILHIRLLNYYKTVFGRLTWACFVIWQFSLLRALKMILTKTSSPSTSKRFCLEISLHTALTS